ncbi:MAG TPA: secretin N-terminal domain-containing protein [Nitrospirota bacterium]|nr:secretin N-terminal domain-containing protein [Nitrospirota bacterium]
MKKTAALLLAGFVTAYGAYAAEKPGPATASPGPSSRQLDARKPGSGDDFITLNFTNIDINALVKVMSELMRRNFILDERVTGKVTLMTPTRISPDEAYQVFLSALELKGFTAIEDGKITRIIPAATARQSGLKVLKGNDFNDQGFVTKLIRLSYVNPNELVRTLTPLVSRDGSLIAYPATNSLIITDATPNVRKMESLIASLDIPVSEGRGKINVYYLKNANSEDFAKVLSALVSRLPVPPAGGIPTAGPSAILEGQVTVASDKATNSLIIVASPSDYETVKDVIQKLDIRRRQVYVEAAIIEMSLTKMRDVGFEFLYAPQEIQTGTGAPTTPLGGTNFGNIANVAATGPAALAQMSGLAVGVIKGTFTYNGATFLNVSALLHALQNDGNVNVLSTPNILTTDNQKAEIMVGQNIPIIAGSTSSAATGGNIQTQINRQDVGIKLQITPQITSDDNVRLEVKQEISDVIQTAGLNANVLGPSTSKRSADTTVVIKDRQTMVIGGLIRDNVTSNTSKVPLLGDIPLLGWLFKTQTTSIEKTNLMIFITPYIIKNETDVAELTKKKGDALEKFRDQYGIEKKDMGGLIETKKPKVAPTGTAPSPAQPAEETGAMENTGTTSAVESTPTGSNYGAPLNNTPIESGPSGTAPTAPLNGMPIESGPSGTAPSKPLNGAPLQTAPTGTVPATPPEGSR